MKMTYIAGLLLVLALACSQQPADDTQTTGNVVAQSRIVFSAAEIAEHNSRESCWIIYDDKVYDVTAGIDTHPGGADKILQSCGKDATAGFDKVRKHGMVARDDLAQSYIGDLA